MTFDKPHAGVAGSGNCVMNRNGVVLTVNAGSSSLRLAAFAAERGLEPLVFARDDNYEEIAGQVRAFLDRHTISSVVRVVHRVVHGGARLEVGRLREATGASRALTVKTTFLGADGTGTDVTIECPFRDGTNGGSLSNVLMLRPIRSSNSLGDYS